jgi:sodium transport system ATP-binding protein
MLELIGIEKVFRKNKSLFGKTSNRNSEDRHAISNVNLNINSGQIIGLIGPNGAGKTTLIRLLATSLFPSTGEILYKYSGVLNHLTEYRKKVGVSTSHTGIYGRLTPLEILNYFGSLYGINKQMLSERIEQLTREFNLSPFLNKRCDHLSTGMQQRISLSRAVINLPEVLLLDEPTTGLDILARENVLNFIESYKNDGRIIIFSTHNIHEVERVCDRIIVIDQGKICFFGSIKDFNRKNSCTFKEGLLKLHKQELV